MKEGHLRRVAEVGDVHHVDIATGPRPDDAGSLLADEEVAVLPVTGLWNHQPLWTAGCRLVGSGYQPADLHRVRRRAAAETIAHVVDDDPGVPGEDEGQSVSNVGVVNPVLGGTGTAATLAICTGWVTS